MSTIVLLNNATAAVTGTAQNVQALRIPTYNRTFQASGQTSSGTGTATINVEVSNDNVTWIIMGTITLTLGTVATSDGFVSQANWTYVRGKIPSAGISGTGASVNLYMGL